MPVHRRPTGRPAFLFRSRQFGFASRLLPSTPQERRAARGRPVIACPCTGARLGAWPFYFARASSASPHGCAGAPQGRRAVSRRPVIACPCAGADRRPAFRPPPRSHWPQGQLARAQKCAALGKRRLANGQTAASTKKSRKSRRFQYLPANLFQVLRNTPGTLAIRPPLCEYSTMEPG